MAPVALLVSTFSSGIFLNSMYPTCISTALFLLSTFISSAIVVFAVDQDQTRLALEVVAQNAYINYHNNKDAMRHHSKAVASIKSRLETLLKDGQNVNVAKNKAFCQKVLSLADEGRDGLKAFDRASIAAGKSFETNRRICQTMKGIRPAENIPKKALQLVANNAAQKFSKHLRASRLHEAQLSATFEAWRKSGKKKVNGRVRLFVPDMIRIGDTTRHQRQSMIAQRESFRNWYVNRRIHATVRGVKTPQFELEGKDYHKVLQGVANMEGRKALN